MNKETKEKPIVLYVDDIKANLMLFEASFDDMYTVLMAESGKEALEVLKTNEIHVLVSDQNMPGMTGNELLEIVTVEYPDIMRFMITAYTDYETVVEAINKGHLYGFFNKPYNIDEVRQSINKSLEVRDLRIKNREMIEKLEKANEVMLSLDRSKTKFLTSVTDEIRMPINKIMTAVHMIKDKIDSAELSELLQLLDVSVSRLECFSESAKHLAQLNSPDFSIQSMPVSVKEIIEIGIIEKGNSMNSEGISIQLTDQATNVSIPGDFDLIQVSFSSLLGYVIEHTGSGSEIEINIVSDKEGTEIGIISKNSAYSDSEKKNLLSLSSDKKDRFEKELSMELILANEIMYAHEGRLNFINEKNRSGFSMNFPQ